MNAAWWHGYNFACRSEGIIGAIELGAIGQANQQAYLNGQRDMLAKCIAEVERIHSPIRIDDDLSYCRKCADAAYGEYSYAWPCAVVTSVRALQQPSGPIEDLTDEEADAYYEARKWGNMETLRDLAGRG
jgi:hypothetical protein